MKLATIFTTVTLLTVLSCLSNNLATCHTSTNKIQNLHPIEKTRNENPISKPEALELIEHSKNLNVLILTLEASGHTSVPLALAEELIRRGHKVTISTSGNKSQEAVEKVGVAFKSNGPGSNMVEKVQKQKDQTTTFLIKMIPEMSRVFALEMNQFTDMILAETKAGTKWDIIMSTDFLMTLLPCLAAHLNIPAIMLGTTMQIYPHTYPAWPWPSSITGGTNDDMTFLRRFGHAIERILAPTLFSFLFYRPATFSIARVCPELTTTQIVNAPAVYIPNIVPTVIGFEFPRTMTPLTHYVGPVQSEHPASLSPELETWLANKKEKRVVYISMGSLISVTKEMAEALIEGIQRANYSVVWAMRKSQDFQLNIDPEQFYISKWLPQLAVLRHTATRLAIVHGGANGVHESLNSGVPVIVLPKMVEQIGNAGRVHHHRLGIHLNQQGLTAEQVYQSIVEIDSGDYRENVRKLQKVFRAAGGAKRAADLVEFYSEVGYDHLIPAYAKYNWSWVQYYNADVYALLLLCALVTLYIDYKILKCLYSRCCKSKKQKIE